MKSLFTWRQLVGATAVLLAYDVLQLSSGLLANGLPQSLVHLEDTYVSSLGLVLAHDIAFVALVLSLLCVGATLNRAISRRISSPQYTRGMVVILMVTPFGVAFGAGKGLAELMPRWLSTLLIIGTMTVAFIGAWEGRRRLMDWLLAEDSAARSITRLALLATSVGLLWADGSLLRDLYVPLHFLWSAMAVIAAITGLTYPDAAERIRPWWLIGIAGSGLFLVPITSSHAPMAHAGAVSTSLGARHNAQIANYCISTWAGEPPLTARPVRSDANTGGLDFASEAKPHVVLVSIDGVRADNVGFWGANRDTTPFLDRLASRSLVYTRAYSPASSTMGTLSSILTNGTLEPLHDWNTVERDSYCPTVLPIDTLPMVFQAADYRTLCDFAYARETLICATTGCDELVDTRQRGQSFDLVLRKLRISQKPIFGLIHLLDTHAPYRGFGSQLIEQTPNWSNYERSILGMDRALEHFYREANEAAQRPIVWVFLSDHGEALGEHGHSTHNTSLYEEQIHVPLLVSGPGIEPGRVDVPVSLQWLYNTLTAVVDEPSTGLALPSGSANSFAHPVFLHNRSWYGVVDGHWKYIEVRDIGARWLFNLEQDPDEMVNLLARHPQRATRLKQLLEQRFPK